MNAPDSRTSRILAAFTDAFAGMDHVAGMSQAEIGEYLVLNVCKVVPCSWAELNKVCSQAVQSGAFPGIVTNREGRPVIEGSSRRTGPRGAHLRVVK